MSELPGPHHAKAWPRPWDTEGREGLGELPGRAVHERHLFALELDRDSSMETEPRERGEEVLDGAKRHPLAHELGRPTRTGSRESRERVNLTVSHEQRLTGVEVCRSAQREPAKLSAVETTAFD